MASENAYSILSDICSALGDPVPPAPESLKQSNLTQSSELDDDEDFGSFLTSLTNQRSPTAGQTMSVSELSVSADEPAPELSTRDQGSSSDSRCADTSTDLRASFLLLNE